MTTPCKLCGILIEYEPIDGFPALVPRGCVSCGDSEAVKNGITTAANAAAHREQLWAELCPVAYRTVSEGGITDVSRLPALDWPEVTREKPGLLMIGPSGLGKTRWTWRVLRQEFDHGQKIAAFTPRGFEAEYRDADGKHELKAFLNRCGKAGAFFLDDLGKASWSPNTLETFYEIVEVRASNLRPIFVTTNFTGSALANQLKMDDGILQPLIRRLRENCRCIEV